MADDSSRLDLAGFRAGWCRMAGTGDAPLSAVSPVFAARLAQQVGAALAAQVLNDDGQLLSPEAVKVAAAWSRLSFASQRGCLDLLQQKGLGGVVLKGYANAYALYPQAALRVGDDLDLLVRRAELPLLLRCLADADYRLQPLRSPRGGLTSDVSFWPLVSPDGRCALDLHVEADAAPWAHAMPACDVFQRAVPLVGHGTTILAPSKTDSFLLLVSNLAKDKFGAASTRRLLDALRLLAEGDLAWSEIEALARRAKLLKPLRISLALLCALGAEADKLPVPVPKVRGLKGLLFRRVVRQWLTLDFPPMSFGEALAREWLLGASPSVAARRLCRRFASLLRPEEAAPPGWSGPILPKA